MSEDDEELEEYDKFVQEMAKECRCDIELSPCDGLLSGGLCDEIHRSVECYCEHELEGNE